MDAQRLPKPDGRWPPALRAGGGGGEQDGDGHGDEHRAHRGLLPNTELGGSHRRKSVEVSRRRSYPRSIVRLLAVCALLFAVTTLAAAGSPRYVINGDRNIGGVRIGQTQPVEAVSLFGPPNLLRADRSNSCLANWRGIGLAIRFATFKRDPCSAGVAVTVTITSDTWQTTVGLRVGDSTRRLQSLYPQAPLQTNLVGSWNGYWLVTRSACNQTGRWRYPALLARLRQGHVAALVASSNACDIS